ncbi:MAG: Ribonucleotide reductase of class II (coenzyme B12-dependent), alpha subunit [Rhodanobacteraceae bacterium]|nr:MAG: Ribonucleotide reductase of class II (coenzyme B12-dependent), alpha subunit [Rhodanobacteraceae bacterium]
MTIRINKKIKGYQVLGNEAPSAAPAATPAPVAPAEPVAAEIIQMHEKLERPEILIGATYKIKSPLFEHALYVTINDIVLNAGTEFEMRRPFEIFINSKNMDHFQWIVALTRIMSAVFRKGGDVTFLVEELKAVFDPRGGYFKAGGVYMPSIVAELGAIIEQHLTMIGLLKGAELSDAQKKLIAEKRAAYERKNGKKNAEISTAGEMGGAMVGEDAENHVSPSSSSRRKPGSSASSAAEDASDSAGSFPPGAAMCGKCNTQALVLLDGCQTCLNCGYSKCG